jgi:type I restriction enzyme M protein
MGDFFLPNKGNRMPPRKKKSEATTNGNGNGIVGLTKELWQAAVTLRGSIEPADYKRYVLPIIFLRFLSLRYEKRRAELEFLIADPQSEYHDDKGAITDADEYRAAGAFIIPEEARWENILKQAQADDIKVRLDNILELLEKTYPDKLRGLLPRIYAGSNLERESVTGLINLFSKDVFRLEHDGEDLIGRVYEYFIGEFASSEGKRGGEYFTPVSIVRTLVGMLEPDRGVVFDPCCGSGGMFVQSDLFTKHNRQLSFVGQESKDFTYRLCRMNLFIHGIDGNIQLGNSYTDDKHSTVKADYILANPPFNDGSKGEDGWGSDRVPDKDSRLVVSGQKMPLATRNANTMWIMHFLYHMAETGTAGFVMATGELSNSEIARIEVRKSLVESDYVDCIVQLSGQLFANTQIPCALWFLSKNRNGQGGFRRRTGEILFIDGRKLGTLIPGSRKQKQLSAEEVERIAAVYREYRRTGVPAEVPGFCKVASLDEIREHKYALTPGRYVGAEEAEEDDETFEEKMLRLVKDLRSQIEESAKLDTVISEWLAEAGYGE